ncbi:hypothetical protein Salat_2485000 [Sesamum alatum]|uniref:Uncharacterized protein n=1 Tax=Sesamum alatum TaxID=300844 RepID=A0AAE1XRA0_9LAMI|nr:hypothetical protein Salat_2485000 [Sesamum alatum]
MNLLNLKITKKTGGSSPTVSGGRTVSLDFKDEATPFRGKSDSPPGNKAISTLVLSEKPHEDVGTRRGKKEREKVIRGSEENFLRRIRGPEEYVSAGKSVEGSGKRSYLGRGFFRNKKTSNMDLNLEPEENVGFCAGDEVRKDVESVVKVLGRVEKLLGGAGEEEGVGEGRNDKDEGEGDERMEEGKEELGSYEEEGEGDLGGKGEGKENGSSDMEEIEKVKDGALNRRASRRKSCQLAKEKILRLNEESDEWEDLEIPRKGRKRRRKGVRSEDDGGESAGEEKNGKEESQKRRRGRRRKVLIDGAEEGVEEDKNEGGIGRKGVRSEDDGGETAGEEKNGKEESQKRRRGRRRKVLIDGAEEGVEEDRNDGELGGRE